MERMANVGRKEAQAFSDELHTAFRNRELIHIDDIVGPTHEAATQGYQKGVEQSIWRLRNMERNVKIVFRSGVKLAREELEKLHAPPVGSDEATPPPEDEPNQENTDGQ